MTKGMAQSNRLYTTQQGLATSDINSLCVDSRGLIWIAGKGTIGYFDGAMFHYVPNKDPNTGNLLFTNTHVMTEDKDGNFWVGTNRGLMYFDSRKLSFTHIKLDDNENNVAGFSVKKMVDIPAHNNSKLIITEGYGVYVLDTETHKVMTNETKKLQEVVEESFILVGCVDHKDRLWINSIRRELICIDTKTFKRIPFNMTEDAKQMVLSNNISEIVESKERNCLYVASLGGLMKFDESTKTLSVIPTMKNKTVQALLLMPDNEVYAGTDSEGIWRIDENDHAENYEVADQQFDLSLGKVKDMVKDKDDNMVIALLQKGLLVIPHHDDEFSYHAISYYKNGKNTSCITSIDTDSKNNYWIATDGAGLFLSNEQHLNNAHPINNGLRSLLVQSVVVDKHDRVWVATYGGGVQLLVNDHFVTPSWIDLMKNLNIKGMCYDKQNDKLIVGSNGNGVFRVDPNTQSFDMLHVDGQSAWTSCVYVDEEGVIWIGDVAAVHYIDEANNKRGSIKPEDFRGTPNCFLTMGKGADKRVFIGSTQGIVIYTPHNGKMERIIETENIASLSESNDDIWVSASNRIYAINKKTMKVERYTSLGGFYFGEFHQCASFLSPDGHIYFGSDNGIISFDPKSIRRPHKISNQILFTSLRVNNTVVNYSDSTNYLDCDLLFADRITLPYDENSLRLTFSVPHLSAPRQVQYEYFLEGFDQHWVPCTMLQSAFYNNLPSGNYTLRVKAYIEGDPSSAIENTIKIKVLHPWYDTVYAYIAYVLLVCIIGYAIWHFVRNRRQQRRALREALHNEEIKEAKLRMFTSIAHELRNPLTMIVSPLKHLISVFDDKDEAENADRESVLNNLNIMKHNSNRLLDIVKQITDIRKIDAGQFRLHFQEVNICEYIRNIATSFLGAANMKHITFTVDDSESVIHGWIDPIHFEKIIVNILSNAFKFCPEGNRISVRNRINGNNIEISIYNSGSKIEDGALEHIYERFYQTPTGKAQSGSGIGLNLAYELVQLHHGTIVARNVEPDGVEFVVTIPLGKVHLSDEELAKNPDEENISNRDSLDVQVTDIETETKTEEGNAEEDDTKHIPSLLIVDDKKDILEYLKGEFQQDYSVSLAFSGNSAWNLVLQNRPDVIVTDVKMPDGDGIELVRRIKSNPELDHIPIIMLTGEGDDQIHIESINLSVDHYIQKPFNIIILKGLVRQVLRVRDSMKKHIKRTDISAGYESIEIDSAEERMFTRINESLQKHIDDSEFGVQELANDVGISRVHLNRKMKEKYGMSPNVFIRSFRLKQAAYLLVHNKVNVSEVAYRVGFSTHSYFSSSFREYFGMSPKEFVICHAEGENDEALKKLLEQKNHSNITEPSEQLGSFFCEHLQ